VNQSFAPDTIQPDIATGGQPPVEAALPSPAQRRRSRPHELGARASGKLDRIPTIVAIGPFDDRKHAQQLATAFIAVRQQYKAKLVLLGGGVQRAVVIRETSERAVDTSVHVASGSCEDRWSDMVGIADVVVLSSSSGPTTLLEVLAAGKAVVAPADPVTVQLVVPAIAGLVYPRGDLPAMTAALLRLMKEPVLRRGMGCRAINVARRHRLEASARQLTSVEATWQGHAELDSETGDEHRRTSCWNRADHPSTPATAAASATTRREK
jgi:glycosyltransferase involved in cell wall biosynthesis